MYPMFRVERRCKVSWHQIKITTVSSSSCSDQPVSTLLFVDTSPAYRRNGLGPFFRRIYQQTPLRLPSPLSRRDKNRVFFFKFNMLFNSCLQTGGRILADCMSR